MLLRQIPIGFLAVHISFPQLGVVGFKSILHILNEIGYSGFLSIECLPKPDPDQAARGAIDFLKKVAGH
jgi:sugar phosphate isomerase/epimerase